MNDKNMNDSQPYACWTGRFQPAHLGHFEILKHSLKILDFPHVCILTTYFGWSSSNDEYSRHAQINYSSSKNPFSVWERFTLLNLGIKELGLEEDVSIIVAPRHDWNWDIVSSFYPPVRLICLTNKDNFEYSKAKIWKSRGEKIIIIDVKNISPLLTTTAIKQKVALGMCWKNFLPESTHSYFESIDGPFRLFGINKPTCIAL